MNVWTKIGSDYNKDLPVLCGEHEIPNCDDPELILKCLNDETYRKEWDDNIDAYQELTEYGTPNSALYRVL